MYRLIYLIADTINLFLKVHTDLCPFHICVAPDNSRTARCVLGKSVALQKHLIINKQTTWCAKKQSPTCCCCCAVRGSVLNVLRSFCSRRNSELCLFGFNHCEVSAQLCKTSDTNLSKEHTEVQQEAQVW